jgi:hypothetical protein
MENVTVIVRMLGKKWSVSGRYLPRFNGNGITPSEPAKFELTGIAQEDGGDVGTVLQYYRQDEIEAIALRKYEEELAYAEQAANHKEQVA